VEREKEHRTLRCDRTELTELSRRRRATAKSSQTQARGHMRALRRRTTATFLSAYAGRLERIVFKVTA
jgi:hypothetical protein